MKKLSELYDIDDDRIIKAIKINSKEVEKGDIFVCTNGVTADRHLFVDEAIENGASAIVASRDIGKKIVPVIYVADTNKELAKLAKRLYDFPDEKLQIFGITGTNGKTTVASIIQDLLGNNICGYIGTNGLITNKFSEKIRNTTPDADRLYMYLDRIVKTGCKYLSLETSSEAFYRKRLEEITFDVGIITNITQDHLNIHKTLENYVNCKLELLKKVSKNGLCILNTEDKYFEEECQKSNGRIVTYGKSKKATLRLVNYQSYTNKTIISVLYKDQKYQFTSPLIGEFNIYNLLAAMLVLLEYLGYSMKEVIGKIKNIKVVPGRLEFLNYGQNYHIVLDYAHTPDAFTKIYDVLTRIDHKRLITVTGSAGGREKEKRGPMGKIVLENSDYVIFTMDDPRNEDVNSIINDLVSSSENTNYERIIDRNEAINRALSMAKKDDLVLIAGKGTDNYMAVSDEYVPYSDVEVINNYFKSQKQ